MIEAARIGISHGTCLASFREDHKSSCRQLTLTLGYHCLTSEQMQARQEKDHPPQVREHFPSSGDVYKKALT